MIKILQASSVAEFTLRIAFSDGAEGVFEGAQLLAREGPLLEPLRDPTYFARAFVDAGGLAWPNGLELSATRVREQCRILQAKRPSSQARLL